MTQLINRNNTVWVGWNLRFENISWLLLRTTEHNECGGPKIWSPGY